MTPEDFRTVALTFGSLAAGVLATWYFSRLYYKRAGDELRREADALHRATAAIIYFLEHPKAQIEVQRDEAGRVTGLIVSGKAHGSVTITARGTLTDANAGQAGERPRGPA